MYRFAFVMDQQVGLRTQALNFQRVVGEDADVRAAWAPVCYEKDAGPLSRLPLLPGGVRGTLRGVREIRDALGDGRGYEAILWATWAAKSVPDLVRAAPAFLVMDMTPVQMEAMGALYGYTSARARLGADWKRRATVRLYEEAAHLFPWNDWVAASLRDDYGVPPEKITPVSPGVDTDLYRPDPAARPGDGVVRLLFVGGDFARKGGDLLLCWMRETRVSEPWEVHLVTRDPVPPAPGLVVHHGLGNNSPELVRLYQQSDVFVLPTRADCYSLVALEAMAAGLPVVISNLGGIPDLVAEGETGYLVAPDDTDMLFAHLDRLVADGALRRRLGDAGRQRAVARFGCRAGIQSILGLMKAAVPAAPPLSKV